MQHEYGMFYVQKTESGMVLITGGEELPDMELVGVVTSAQIYNIALGNAERLAELELGL